VCGGFLFERRITTPTTIRTERFAGPVEIAPNSSRPLINFFLFPNRRCRIIIVAGRHRIIAPMTSDSAL
jgi:hypothetical protein